MRFIFSLVAATAYAGPALIFEDENVKITAETKIDGDQFKVEGNMTRKSEGWSISEVAEEYFFMFIYAASNASQFNGKTLA